MKRLWNEKIFFYFLTKRFKVFVDKNKKTTYNEFRNKNVDEKSRFLKSCTERLRLVKVVE